MEGDIPPHEHIKNVDFGILAFKELGTFSKLYKYSDQEDPEIRNSLTDKHILAYSMDNNLIGLLDKEMINYKERMGYNGDKSGERGSDERLKYAELAMSVI